MVRANAVALFNYDFGVVDTTGKMIYQNNSDARAWEYVANSIPAEVIEDEVVIDPVVEEEVVDENNSENVTDETTDEIVVNNQKQRNKWLAEKTI